MLNHISSGFILIIFVIRYFYNNILNIREYKNIFFVDKFFFFFFLNFSFFVIPLKSSYEIKISFSRFCMEKKKEIRKFPVN